ncbi:ribosomal protein S5 domain 2-type protein [Syncephalis fuscata]|nr:ribosomal protein S5 domain 2-type protein [Syncephalis fuscata]
MSVCQRLVAAAGLRRAGGNNVSILSALQLPHRSFASEATQDASTITIRDRPGSPAYFTGQPIYNDLLANLDQLWADTRQRLAISVPQSTITANNTTADASKSTEVSSAGWLSRERMSQILGVDLTTTQYRRIIEKLNRVWRQPGLAEHLPLVIKDLASFQRAESGQKQQMAVHTIDRFASARVWLVRTDEPHTGQVLINGKPLATYFVRMEDREAVVESLTRTDLLGQFNAWCLVRGGGTTGQAEAIRLAVTRALLVHEPTLKPALRHAGLVSHDARVVERKKPGQPKARKKYTWVKR